MALGRISVVGIGKLGLCAAACFASKGYQVFGVDINQDTIAAVNEGKAPIYEPMLAGLMNKCHKNLSAGDDYKYAIENSEITFIIVPTPSQEDGSFSTKYVVASIIQIAANLKNLGRFHTVVLTSTVLPGVTDDVVKQALEKISGKKCGKDFGLCYSPEFIALGSVIRDFINPDMILIGESDPKSGELLAEVYQHVCENNPPIVRTAIRNAELAKISLNAFITMKITFANTIAEICEQIPGGDADAISNALGFDSRIGRKYLSGGLAYGGPCFPRDNKAFAFFAHQTGCQAKLSITTDEVNQGQNGRIVSLIEQELEGVNNKNIAILGLTYKPNTDVVEESAAIKIAVVLRQKGARLAVYDPAGIENAKLDLRDYHYRKGIKYASSIEECLKDADLCILATPWDKFNDLKPEDFTTRMKSPVLIDCWRMFNYSEFSEKLKYIAIGVGNKDEV